MNPMKNVSIIYHMFKPGEDNWPLHPAAPARGRLAIAPQGIKNMAP